MKRCSGKEELNLASHGQIDDGASQPPNIIVGGCI